MRNDLVDGMILIGSSAEVGRLRRETLGTGRECIFKTEKCHFSRVINQAVLQWFQYTLDPGLPNQRIRGPTLHSFLI